MRKTSSAKSLFYMFHSVGSGKNSISSDYFEKFVRRISEWASIVSVRQNLGIVSGSEAAPRPINISITFDDGYLDNYEAVLPMLSAMNIPFCVFVIPSLLGKKDTYGRRYMTGGMVREMARASVATIGSHTMTHPDLTAISPEKVKIEIESSKKALEDLTGFSIQFFAYPYSRATHYAVGLLKENNFAAAFCGERRTYGPGKAGNMYHLGRIGFSQEHPRIDLALSSNVPLFRAGVAIKMVKGRFESSRCGVRETES